LRTYFSNGEPVREEPEERAPVCMIPSTALGAFCSFSLDSHYSLFPSREPSKGRMIKKGGIYPLRHEASCIVTRVGEGQNEGQKQNNETDKLL